MRISQQPGTQPGGLRHIELTQQETFMGKGDSRTRRGKIIKGSFGNSRPKGKKKPAGEEKR